MTADPRARWAAALRVPETASAADALAALLRGLPDTDFLPPAERVAAANALAGTAAPVGRAPDVDQLLCDEVAAFAARFWSLAPADRSLAWSELSRRGADAVRLRELEPGLDVTAPPLADIAAEELAALVRELFALPPRARAIRRNQWLLGHAADGDKWRAAHAALLRDAPALAALEPRLARVLEPASRGALAEFAEGAAAAPLRPTRMSDEVTLAGLPDRVRHTAGYTESGEYVYEAADRQNARSVFHGGVLALVLLIGGCGVLGRLLPRSGHDGARRSSPTAWNYAPAHTPATPREEFTDAQVAEFEMYERANVTNVRGAPPRGYSDWLRAGRPRAPGTRPGQRVVHITQEQILAFQAYASRGGLPPPHYTDWVWAGRPTRPGPLFVSAYP